MNKHSRINGYLPGGYFSVQLIVMKSRLSAAAAYLFCYISSCWQNFSSVYVNDEKLSKILRMKKTSIADAKAELVDYGLIEITIKGHNHKATVNEEAANNFFGCKYFTDAPCQVCEDEFLEADCPRYDEDGNSLY